MMIYAIILKHHMAANSILMKLNRKGVLFVKDDNIWRSGKEQVDKLLLDMIGKLHILIYGAEGGGVGCEGMQSEDARGRRKRRSKYPNRNPGLVSVQGARRLLASKRRLHCVSPRVRQHGGGTLLHARAPICVRAVQHVPAQRSKQGVPSGFTRALAPQR